MVSSSLQHTVVLVDWMKMPKSRHEWMRPEGTLSGWEKSRNWYEEEIGKRLISATAVEKAAHGPLLTRPYLSMIGILWEKTRLDLGFSKSQQKLHMERLQASFGICLSRPQNDLARFWGYLVAETVCASGYCISSVLTSTYLGCRQGFGIFVSGSSEALSIFSKFDLRHFIKFVCVKESFGEWAGNAGPWQVPQSSRQQKKTVSVIQSVKEKGGWLKSATLFEAPVPNAQRCRTRMTMKKLEETYAGSCESSIVLRSMVPVLPRPHLTGCPHRPWETVKECQGCRSQRWFNQGFQVLETLADSDTALFICPVQKHCETPLPNMSGALCFCPM